MQQSNKRIGIYIAVAVLMLLLVIGIWHAVVLVPDEPESKGVRNALENFSNLYDVEYRVIREMPQQRGSFQPGTYQGLPYSSPRPEAGYVPVNVSFYTFLTALEDPESYLYTVDLKSQGVVNAGTYYGCVCSAACLYALGIDDMYSTYSWHFIPGMELFREQSLRSVRLGDMICIKEGGHIVMVTGIERDPLGKIRYLTISQSKNPRVTKRRISMKKAESKYPPDRYNYYRYSYIDDVQLRQAVPDISGKKFELMPKKGDKSNWLEGQPVEIDVLDTKDYEITEIYKDGKTYKTLKLSAAAGTPRSEDVDSTKPAKDTDHPLDEAKTFTLNDLKYGSYKARLSGHGSHSNWVYWMVVDAKSSVTDDGDVRFSCSNAEPVTVSWCDETSGSLYAEPISKSERSNGTKSGISKNLNSFQWKKVRVGFRTEYGIIYSEFN